ncbi:uncharacterized protein BJ171DRAFT_33426 [Polychytrium aggregatum]|uniref:uncharacterized protein n=1 Tax=Polychytrium aggregatum TaxID=110093 RepID=UPI0022FE156A|nr:uncharacterized protein BJ171DRAFT_33426 [Polychytrium aggregatum]KAI9192945.1 hypothetical protein BJ171DRAFT_33426 [Polychytrium aggregatum]
METNMVPQAYSRMIDMLAAKVRDNIHSWAPKNKRFRPESVDRFACLMAALGSNEYALIADSTWLKTIRPQVYFPELPVSPSNPEKAFVEEVLTPQDFDMDDSLGSPTVAEPTKVQLPPLKHYKLAYFLMMHEGIENVKLVLRAIYDPEAIVLIHVDSHRPKIHKEITEYVCATYRQHIYVMRRSLPLAWGGSGIVFAQIAGFFNLHDLARWDYVINLSGYDYPLMSTSTIHDILEVTGSRLWANCRCRRP